MADRWTVASVSSAISDGASEGLSLEFKAKLPDKTDRDRAEFLKDISALANTAGGSIIYGVDELNARAKSFSGIRIESPDAEIRRLSQIAESGLEPRIVGLQFYCLSSEEGDVLVVDVPESYESPHRYLFNGHSKFVQRAATHTSELSYDELRASFMRSSSRIDRVRAEWNKEISTLNGWRPILEGPVCAVRLSPISSGDGRQLIDPLKAEEHWSKLILEGWGGGSPAFNYDGLAVFPGRGDGPLNGYVQVHRTGSISAFRTAKALAFDGKLIPANAVTKFIFEATGKLFSFARQMEIRGSALLNIGLNRLAGYRFVSSDGHGFTEERTADLDIILMPEIWIERIEDSADLDIILRPGLDLLWQSYGHSRCSEFDQQGKRLPQFR